MTNANYTAISDGTILLQGKVADKIVVKKFNTLDEAISYADNAQLNSWQRADYVIYTTYQ